MFDKTAFEQVVKRENKTFKDIALMLNIAPSTLYRKAIGDSDFYRDEMDKISIYLNLAIGERERIFFAKKNA